MSLLNVAAPETTASVALRIPTVPIPVTFWLVALTFAKVIAP